MQARDYLLDPRPYRPTLGLLQVMWHVAIALAAVGVALSVPVAAQYILYQWWPRVASSANLLLALEVSLAATLMLLFNMWRIALENSHKGRVADAAALVYARRDRTGWLARLRERSLVRNLPATRDACVLTLTGYDTFSDANSLLREPLQSAYEIRVMLLNPDAPSAEKRIGTLPRGITRRSYLDEIETSIAHLGALRKLGKKVTLKFYETEPFWKVVVLGDHVWVQYCHSGYEVKGEPEYVFALNREHPRLGLYVPFYMYFLEQWSDARHPHYDFDSGELVYCDPHGREIRRARLAGAGAPPLFQPGRESNAHVE